MVRRYNYYQNILYFFENVIFYDDFYIFIVKKIKKW